MLNVSTPQLYLITSCKTSKEACDMLKFKRDTLANKLFLKKKILVFWSKILIDSGASKHMTCHEEILQNCQKFPRPQSVKLGDGRVVDALGFDNVKLRMAFKVSDVKNFTMFDVLYVPKLSRNLFSVGAAVRRENTVQFKKSRCFIRRKRGDFQGMETQRSDRLYQLDVEGSSPSCHCASGDLVTASLWHQRLGYTTKMKELKNLVNGVDLPAEKEVPFCEACVEGKLSRKPHKPVGEICSKRNLQLVHRDIWGPMQTESIGRSKYFVTFIDYYSRCLQIQGVWENILQWMQTESDKTKNGQWWGIHFQRISRILEGSRYQSWDNCTSHTSAKWCCRKKE